jgi:hypothetical protein
MSHQRRGAAKPEVRSVRRSGARLAVAFHHGCTRAYLGAVGLYEVLIRSANDSLSAVGAHVFDYPPIEGTEISFNGEQWTIEEIDERYSPPQVTLIRR